MGTFVHACEGEMVCQSINPKIPHFNAQIFLENKVRKRRYTFHCEKTADSVLLLDSGWQG